MSWQTEAFGLATGYDEAAGRYVGLWTPQDTTSAPVATDSLLLVRPDVAIKQTESEAAPKLLAADQVADRIEEHGGGEHDPSDPKADVIFDTTQTRIFGVQTLKSDKIAMEFKNIDDEYIANLRTDEATTMNTRHNTE